ncbi:MAG: sulfotransferase domain-containing protein [Candidatus Hodarchaeota archaeon]
MNFINNRNKYIFKNLIVIVSHRRSGTHWIIDSIRKNSNDVSQNYFNLDQMLESSNKYISPDEFITLLNEYKKNKLKPILKTHMTANFSPFTSKKSLKIINEIIDNSKIIYVYRDGRDVMVSFWYYMKKFTKNLPDFSDFIIMNNDSDPTYSNLNRIEYWKEHIVGWFELTYKYRNICLVSYEELYYTYQKTMKHIFNFLELQKLYPKFKEVKLQDKNVGYYFKKLMAKIIPINMESTSIHPRKGIVGDHKNHFTKKDLDLFYKIAGDFMKKLGYY